MKAPGGGGAEIGLHSTPFLPKTSKKCMEMKDFYIFLF
jgi:hypothetical protein